MSKLEYSPKWGDAAWGESDCLRGFSFSETPPSPRVPSAESEQGATTTPVALKATVISSVPLSHDELDDLVHRLQHEYKSEIRAEVKVQPGTVGRVKVEVGGELWDASRRATVEPIDRGQVRVDDERSLNALPSGRGENCSETEPATSASGLLPQHSMQLGRAIVAPPIPQIDRYECLQSNLLVRYPVAMTRVMLVVGANEGCGASTAAASLAAILARDARAKVLFIDANVRCAAQSPLVSQGTGFDEAEVSLSRLLSDAPVLREPTPGPSNLYVLPSGVSRSSALSVFQTPQFDELLRKARELFKYVIIDAPSLAAHPESLLLSRQANGVILVLESERTRRQSAIWAKQQIEMAGGTLLGVILNRRKYRIPDWLYRRI